MAEPTDDDLEKHFLSLGDDDGLESHFTSILQDATKTAVSQTRGLARLEMPVQALAGATQNTLGLPGMIESGVNSMIPSSAVSAFRETNPNLAKLAFSPPVDFKSKQFFPTGSDLAEVTGLGLEKHPELKAENALERYGNALAGAAPNAAALWATGGMSAAPAIATSIGGAVAAQAAADFDPEGKVLPIVAGIVGSLGAGWASSAAKESLAASAAAKKYANATTALEIAKRNQALGREDAITAAANVKLAAEDQFNSTTKLAAHSLESAHADADTVVAKVADSLGTAKDFTDVGKAVQPKLRNWLDKIYPEKMKAVSDPLDIKVPSNAQSDIPGFSAVYSKIDKKDLLNRLDLPDTLNADVKNAMELGVPLTWKQNRELRTALGSAMARPSIVKSVGEGEINALYSASTQDLSNTAKLHGADAEFSAFNAESTRLNRIKDGIASKIVSTKNEKKELITPEAAGGALAAEARRGPTELALLRGEIPDALDDLAAVHLRNPKQWDKLGDKSKAVLVSDPTSAQALSDAAQMRLVAQNAHDSVVSGAEAQMQKDVVEAARVAREQRKGNIVAVREAKELHSEAKAGLPAPKPGLMDQFLQSKNSLLTGAIIGNEMLPGVLSHANLHPNALTGAAVGAMVIPPLWKGVKATAKDPRLLMVPATGAAAGQNALSAEQPK